MTKTSTPENLQFDLAKSPEMDHSVGMLPKASEDAKEVVKHKSNMHHSKKQGPSKKSLSLILQFAAAIESFEFNHQDTYSFIKN